MMLDLVGHAESPAVKSTRQEPPYSIDCTEHEESVSSFRKDEFLPISEEVVLYQQHWNARGNGPESKREWTVAELLGEDDLAWTLDDLIERSKDGRIIIVRDGEDHRGSS